MSSKKNDKAAIAAASVPQTPLPTYQIACILFVQICEGLNGKSNAVHPSIRMLH
jgi:hypothetical protein